jgi:uncharacterized protein (TIGR02594 family)
MRISLISLSLLLSLSVRSVAYADIYDRALPNATQSFSSSLVSVARSSIGATARQLGLRRVTLWCATVLDQIWLPSAGYSPLGTDRARDFKKYGRRVQRPVIGAIAVLSRGRNGGHVGVVSGITRSGDPILISGNVRRHVTESAFSRHRVIAYVIPP